METVQELKCKDKVKDSFKRSFNTIKTLYDAYLDGQEYVENLGSINEYSLSFDYVPKGTFSDQRLSFFRYQICYGGPSTEYRFFIDGELKPYKIEYWYLDWFDGAYHKLSGKAFDYMSDFFIEYLGCGDTDYLNQLIEKATEE